MEEKIYQILKKHKLTLKKRELLMPDLLSLVFQNNIESICECEDSCRTIEVLQCGGCGKLMLNE